MDDIISCSRASSPWSGEEDEGDLGQDSFQDILTESIKQMMFVSGETAEPSIETTGIIEDIVRQQVIELVGLKTRANKGPN